MSSLHEISTLRSPVTNGRGRKKRSKTTNRRDLDVTIVTRGCCRIAAIEIVRLIPGRILRVMPMRKHRCKNLSNETINNLFICQKDWTLFFTCRSFVFKIVNKIHTKGNKERENYESPFFLSYMRESRLCSYICII